MGLLRHKETTIRFLGNLHTSKSCCISEKGISLDEKKKPEIFQNEKILFHQIYMVRKQA